MFIVYALYKVKSYFVTVCACVNTRQTPIYPRKILPNSEKNLRVDSLPVDYSD